MGLRNTRLAILSLLRSIGRLKRARFEGKITKVEGPEEKSEDYKIAHNAEE